jgi:hypothetical protein
MEILGGILKNTVHRWSIISGSPSWVSNHDSYEKLWFLILLVVWRFARRSLSSRTKSGPWWSQTCKPLYLQNRPSTWDVHSNLWLSSKANVLMDDNRVPRICDYGLMRIYLEERCNGLDARSSSMGSGRYIAPELVFASDDAIPTAASDVWAIGCVGLDVSQSNFRSPKIS